MDFYLRLQNDISQLYKINKIVTIISLFLFAVIVAFLIVLFCYLYEFFYVYPKADINNINYALFGLYTPKMFTGIFISFCVLIIILFSLCFLFSIMLIVDTKNFREYSLDFEKFFVAFWFFLLFPFISWVLFFLLRSKKKKIDSEVDFLRNYDLENDVVKRNYNKFDSENFAFPQLTEEEKKSEIIKEAYELYKKGLISEYDFLKIKNETKIFK